MRAALAVAVLTLVLPAAASASDAYYKDSPFPFDASVEYVAAAGEANDLTVSSSPDGTSFVLTDPGANIKPGNGCHPSGAHSVTCTSPYAYTAFDADLGDRGDRFTSDHTGATVYGGSGRDVLDARRGGGTLIGGEGNDVLYGGGNLSELDGGPGDDELVGGGLDTLTGGDGADTIEGAANGTDTVSYRDHTEPVTVDLRKPGSPAGAAGEGDAITNVRNVYGGEGADKLTGPATAGPYPSTIRGYGGDDKIHGSPGPDFLYGGDGDDTIGGGAGNDVIRGEQGGDTLVGGAGADYLFGRDGVDDIGARGSAKQDHLDCRAGGDRTEPSAGAPSPLDVVDQSCEQVRTDVDAVPTIIHDKIQPPLRKLRMGVRCSSAGPCQVHVSLRAHHRLVGSAERHIDKEHSATLTVALAKRARKELTRRGVLRLRLSLTVDSGPQLAKRETFGYFYVVRKP